MTSIEVQYYKTLLQDLGIKDDDSTIEQLDVMVQALKIFQERNTERYHDLFKAFGWKGMVHDIIKKAMRIWQQWWVDQGKDHQDEDDVLDLINYCCFFIRCRNVDNSDGNLVYLKK